MAEPKTLPVPTSSRWKPLRGGLLNLYYYDDQEFLYEGGRLLLRGNNGTGKSRVLALQLPFLLDGQVSPTRVEPDADPARRIEWHLLMGQRYPARTGYTWIELGRRDDDGTEHVVTLGIGLEALQGKGLKRRWHFVTELRVGETLSLTGPQGSPLGPKELEEALAGRGTVYEHADDYRAEVDRRLFGLGKERYEALLELLIGLRRPQLSRKLDEKSLSEALSLALPPLSSAVLRDVAEAFRRLESERAELERYRTTARTTQEFERVHVRYVAIEGRRRAAELRTAHSKYEALGRERSEKRAALDEAVTDEARLGAEVVELEREATALEAKERTLRESDEMRAAARLHELARAADHARGLLEDAEQRHGRASTLRTKAAEGVRHAGASRDDASDRLARAIRDAREAAETANLPVDLRQPGLESVGDETDGALERLETMVEHECPAAIVRRREELAHLSRLAREERDASDAFRRADTALGSERVHYEAAMGARLEAVEAHERASEALLDAVARYRASLSEIVLPPEESLDDALRAWNAAPRAPSPVVVAAQRSAQERAAALHAEAAAAAASRESAGHERALRAEELALLKAGSPPIPDRLPGRARDARTNKIGAALYALCDFREDVSPRDRAGIEAALEASGLLDAFVSPEGPLRIEGLDDAYLVPESAAPGPSLADVLAPSPDESNLVPEARILAALRSIGLEESAHRAWITRAGGYRIGPLVGAHTKPEAQFVGRGAREAERRRRIAALDDAIAELDIRIERDARRMEVAQAALATVERERSVAPDGADVILCAVRLAEREHVEATKRAAVADAEAHCTACRATRDAARQALDDAAEAFGLRDEELDLHRLASALDRFANRLAVVSDRIRVLRQAIGSMNAASGALEDAIAELERAGATVDAAKTHHATKLAEHEALASAVGSEVNAILERIREVEAARKTNAATQSGTRTALQKKGREVGALSKDVEKLDAQIIEQTATRSVAADELRALLATGALRTLDAAFEGGEAATGASMTRAVELARALEKATGDHPDSKDARERAERLVHENVRIVQDALAGQHYAAQLEFRASVHVLRTTHQGRELDLADLLAHLEAEVAHRQRILAEEERTVIEKYLVDALANEIFVALQNASDVLRDMNDEVERCRLSTGMALRFRWRPLPDLGDRWAACEKVFRRAPSLWTNEERAAVADFLEERIANAQTEHAALPPAERLALALDYRRFHGFEIERQQDGAWHRLTRRTHGTGSGGEKAIALTLPQLAAAAAHYRSVPLAPRFILLDEAFVGIDADAREKCMGMIESLDLDLVMTSEREWGCYPTLGALSIYQLSTRPGIEAILATRFVWNGKELRRVDH